ncbi:hypothetical protein [Chryseobacterium sp. NFX27]|uniref:hypothetical protein n=1 Tax=Chryseobacterium sp. NFX27 TaxID=2819618 RepID=UPI003CEC0AB6
MSAALQIPPGYYLVPEELYLKFFKKMEWQDIIEPTVEDISQYLGIGTDKIKKDIKKLSCPLRKTKEGGKGRGNQIRFIKETVEAYRIWIINN